MKRFVVVLALFLVSGGIVSAQNEEQKSPEEIAAEQAETIAKQFELSDYQLYQVDSMLQVNYPAMLEELEHLRKSGAQNQDMYLNIQNKYVEIIDDSYEKIFTQEQWAKYMKSSYGKAKRQREENKIKAEKKKNKKR